MTTCNELDKRLYQYLDGELGMQDNRELEEHLLHCQRCSELLQEQRRFLTVLANPTLREKGPAALRAKILTQLERKKKRRLPSLLQGPWRLACSGALVLALLVLTLTLLPRQPRLSPFMASLAGSHQEYLQGGESLALASSDPTVVAQWLRQQLGLATAFPRFDDENVVLKGVRSGRFRDQPVAYVSYEVHKVPVTLVVVKKTPETDIETAQHTLVEDRRINFSQTNGFNIVSWSVCDNNFALVSHLPHKGKQGCAVCHANGSGLMDLSEFYTRT